MTDKPKALVLYHFFHPDDVVSAQHIADLCMGLQTRGWDVTVLPSNRSCHDSQVQYPRQEDWEGIQIRRVRRPRFLQASFLGRILNTFWMHASWTLAAFRYRPDVLVVGTDPLFSVLMAVPWKLFQPRTRIFHWCFDLHPEAFIAAGRISPGHSIVRMLGPWLRRAYRHCDLIGSLGPCMTRRLRAYTPKGAIETYTPWALSEPKAPLPVDPVERTLVFGDGAGLALMYSGNFGNPHDAELILALARRLRPHPGIRFAFSIRGYRAKALRDAIGPEDGNISFVGFAPQDRLEQRLGAADIQMVSLRAEFDGIVVPSKFQGALAVGRPILYAGPRDSAVAQWIRELGLGWTLATDNLEEVAQELIHLEADPVALADLNARCHRVYHAHFSRNGVMDHLDHDLRGLLASQGAH